MKTLTLNDQLLRALQGEMQGIVHQCAGQCRAFEIMTSPHWPDQWIIRWIESWSNPGAEQRIIQRYRYRCFDADGAPLHCSIHYTEVHQANAFDASLVSHHYQLFANS